MLTNTEIIIFEIKITDWLFIENMIKTSVWYLSVVQLKCGLVVMCMFVHSVIDHSDVPVHLLTALLLRPVLSTLPPAPLVRPAHTHSHTDLQAAVFVIYCDSVHMAQL